MRANLLWVLAVIGTVPLNAQSPWGITVELNKSGYSAAAYDSSTPKLAVGPGWPTMLTLRLQRTGERHGLAMGVTYVNAPLAGWVDDVTLILASSNELVEIAPEWRYLIARPASGARWITHLGPVFDAWGPSAEPIRWRVGGMAGVTLEFPLSAGWQVGIRGDFAMTGSYLRPEDDDDQLDVEPTMRRTRIGLGITRRL
jgi:hypothetical protein